MTFHAFVQENLNQGVRHMLRETENGGLFVGIAEGCRGCSKASKGAELALEAVSRLFLNGTDFYSLLNSPAKQETFKMRVLTAIHDYLDAEANRTNRDRRDYGSSLMVIYFDKNGDFISVHLGGGEITGQLGTESRTISGAERNLLSGLPYTTTTPGACSHLRLRFGNIRNWENICINSDFAIRKREHDLLISDKKAIRLGSVCQDG